MRLMYEGVDITADVNITECVHHDRAGGKCDCLTMTLENARAWYTWKPQQDDVIRVISDGYDTGALFLNTIRPWDGSYRIIATSVKSTARRRAWKTFEHTTLGGIFDACAAAIGMESGLYGLDEKMPYSFITQKDESEPAFLDRVCRMESGVLKAFDGKLRGISIDYAQTLPAAKTIRLDADTPCVSLEKRDDMKQKGLIVKTLYGEAMAIDSSVKKGNIAIRNDLPALNGAEMGRWSRGLLLDGNRQAETVQYTAELDPMLSALVRVDIVGNTEATGEWLIGEACHDFIDRQSVITMKRCIDTIQ